MSKRLVTILLIMVMALSFAAATSAQETDDNKIVVGTNAEYPPFESVDENEEIVGFDIDLLTALAEDAGFEVEFVNTKWDGIFVALQQGEFDAVVSAATITDEREEIIDFTDPYFNAGQTIAVGADLAETVETIDDLAGLRIGVQLGTTGDELASEIEGAEVVRFDEVTLAFQALGEGEVDAIINDGPTSADIIANNPDLEVVIVGEPLTDEFYGIAVNPEKPELLDALNNSLANVIASGEYAEIYEEYFGQEPPEMFMPAEEGTVEIDFTDPESVFVGLLGTLLSPDVSLEALMPFVCAEAADNPLVPKDETALATFAGIELVDASQIEFETTIEEDLASIVPTGTLVLNIGEFPADQLLTTLGVTEITLKQNEEGNWQICPQAAE